MLKQVNLKDLFNSIIQKYVNKNKLNINNIYLYIMNKKYPTMKMLRI